MSTVYLSFFLDSCMPIAISAILSNTPCCRIISSQFRPPFLCEASVNPFFVHSIFYRNLFIYCPIREQHFGHFKSIARTYVLALDYIITPIDLNVNRGFRCCRRIPTANGGFLKFCRVAQIASQIWLILHNICAVFDTSIHVFISVRCLIKICSLQLAKDSIFDTTQPPYRDSFLCLEVAFLDRGCTK